MIAFRSFHTVFKQTHSWSEIVHKRKSLLDVDHTFLIRSFTTKTSILSSSKFEGPSSPSESSFSDNKKKQDPDHTHQDTHSYEHDLTKPAVPATRLRYVPPKVHADPAASDSIYQRWAKGLHIVMEDENEPMLYQTPVDIRATDVKFNPDLEGTNPLSITYDRRIVKRTWNTGMSVQTDLKGDGSIVKGGPLDIDKFQPVQFHFHWGSDDCSGAEHLLCGYQFPLELHIVHYNTKYPCFKQALKNADGLCVMAIFYEVSDQMTDDSADANPALQRLVDHFEQIQYKTDQTKENAVLALDLYDMLPQNTHEYWTYFGSLSTPPYSESVRWIIFRETLKLSKAQLKAFRTLKTYEAGEVPPNPSGQPISPKHKTDAVPGAMVDNWREVHPMNGRIVYSSFEFDPKVCFIAPEKVRARGAYIDDAGNVVRHVDELALIDN